MTSTDRAPPKTPPPIFSQVPKPSKVPSADTEQRCTTAPAAKRRATVSPVAACSTVSPGSTEKLWPATLLHDASEQ
eukprot:CAMPEP_0206611704 /NCGR_PEP_ID=MMETSP0325_2-20121206/55477_1 /ASSEMBLY_ACC=CAM_ASM_000347 /TAXON_ID=2866 /ORGANISM="Crypthecodinium cohnii, Strain Seligo" /LENGTH=75 /DNA_ID=CAMNT_0054131105 /DNA_START=85 /DNA_END=315 /DNA_ORIENTATION=+